MASVEALNVEMFENLYKGDVDKVRDVLQKGADVNGRDKNGLTPLSVCASAKGSFLTVRELLKHKNLDANATEDDGDSPLLAACRVGNLEVVVELLKDNRVDVNARDCSGDTVLMVAIHRCEQDIAVELLKYAKVDVNLTNNRGYTALLVAICRGEQDIAVELLKHAKVDVNARDCSGYRLHYLNGGHPSWQTRYCCRVTET